MSFCRITGKSRNLPKPNYFPIIPPISPADARRFCRITGKSYGLPMHHYIPVLVRKVTLVSKCRITKIADVDYGKRKHFPLAGFRYVCPVLDETDESQQKLIEILTGKTGEGQFVYTVKERECSLIFSAQMEMAVRDGDIRDVVMAKEENKVVLKLKEGTNVSVDFKELDEIDYINEELYEGEGIAPEAPPVRKKQKFTSGLAQIFEEKEQQAVEKAEHEAIVKKKKIKKENKTCVVVNSDDWRNLIEPLIESWDWETFEKEAANRIPFSEWKPPERQTSSASSNKTANGLNKKIKSPFQVIQEAVSKMSPEQLQKTENVIEKLLKGGKRAIEALPFISEIEDIINKLSSGTLTELETVPGMNVFTEKGRFIAGQMVETKNGNIFVPGQTVTTEKGEEFLPGFIVNTENGLAMIPGLVISKQKHSPVFIPGQNILTNTGVYEFQADNTILKYELLPSTISELSEFEQKLASTIQTGLLNESENDSVLNGWGIVNVNGTECFQKLVTEIKTIEEIPPILDAEVITNIQKESKLHLNDAKKIAQKLNFSKENVDKASEVISMVSHLAKSIMNNSVPLMELLDSKNESDNLLENITVENEQLIKNVLMAAIDVAKTNSGNNNAIYKAVGNILANIGNNGNILDSIHTTLSTTENCQKVFSQILNENLEEIYLIGFIDASVVNAETAVIQNELTEIKKIAKNLNLSKESATKSDEIALVFSHLAESVTNPLSPLRTFLENSDISFLQFDSSLSKETVELVKEAIKSAANMILENPQERGAIFECILKTLTNTENKDKILDDVSKVLKSPKLCELVFGPSATEGIHHIVQQVQITQLCQKQQAKTVNNVRQIAEQLNISQGSVDKASEMMLVISLLAEKFLNDPTADIHDFLTTRNCDGDIDSPEMLKNNEILKHTLMAAVSAIQDNPGDKNVVFKTVGNILANLENKEMILDELCNLLHSPEAKHTILGQIATEEISNFNEEIKTSRQRQQKVAKKLNEVQKVVREIISSPENVSQVCEIALVVSNLASNIMNSQNGQFENIINNLMNQSNPDIAKHAEVLQQTLKAAISAIKENPSNEKAVFEKITMVLEHLENKETVLQSICDMLHSSQKCKTLFGQNIKNEVAEIINDIKSSEIHQRESVRKLNKAKLIAQNLNMPTEQIEKVSETITIIQNLAEKLYSDPVILENFLKTDVINENGRADRKLVKKGKILKDLIQKTVNAMDGTIDSDTLLDMIGSFCVEMGEQKMSEILDILKVPKTCIAIFGENIGQQIQEISEESTILHQEQARLENSIKSTETLIKKCGFSQENVGKVSEIMLIVKYLATKCIKDSDKNILNFIENETNLQINPKFINSSCVLKDAIKIVINAIKSGNSDENAIFSEVGKMLMNLENKESIIKDISEILYSNKISQTLFGEYSKVEIDQIIQDVKSFECDDTSSMTPIHLTKEMIETIQKKTGIKLSEIKKVAKKFKFKSENKEKAAEVMLILSNFAKTVSDANSPIHGFVANGNNNLMAVKDQELTENSEIVKHVLMKTIEAIQNNSANEKAMISAIGEIVKSIENKDQVMEEVCKLLSLNANCSVILSELLNENKKSQGLLTKDAVIKIEEESNINFKDIQTAVNGLPFTDINKEKVSDVILMVTNFAKNILDSESQQYCSLICSKDGSELKSSRSESNETLKEAVLKAVNLVQEHSGDEKVVYDELVKLFASINEKDKILNEICSLLNVTEDYKTLFNSIIQEEICQYKLNDNENQVLYTNQEIMSHIQKHSKINLKDIKKATKKLHLSKENADKISEIILMATHFAKNIFNPASPLFGVFDEVFNEEHSQQARNSSVENEILKEVLLTAVGIIQENPGNDRIVYDSLGHILSNLKDSDMVLENICALLSSNQSCKEIFNDAAQEIDTILSNSEDKTDQLKAALISLHTDKQAIIDKLSSLLEEDEIFAPAFKNVSDGNPEFLERVLKKLSRNMNNVKSEDVVDLLQKAVTTTVQETSEHNLNNFLKTGCDQSIKDLLLEAIGLANALGMYNTAETLNAIMTDPQSRDILAGDQVTLEILKRLTLMRQLAEKQPELHNALSELKNNATTARKDPKLRELVRESAALWVPEVQLQSSINIPSVLFHDHNALAMEDFMARNRKGYRTLLIYKRGLQAILPKEACRGVLNGTVAYTLIDEKGITHFSPMHAINALKLSKPTARRFSMYECLGTGDKSAMGSTPSSEESTPTRKNSTDKVMLDQANNNVLTCC